MKTATNQLCPQKVPATMATRQSQPDAPQRILVVDGDPFVRRRNTEVLIRHGYEVNATENSEDGWKELQANPYHLLITENEMPRLTGIGLVEKLRAARITLPVILVAETLPKTQPAHQLRLYPAVTLLKPYTTDEILTAVKVVLVATLMPDQETATDERGLQPSVLGLRL